MKTGAAPVESVENEYLESPEYRFQDPVMQEEFDLLTSPGGQIGLHNSV